MTQPPIPDNAKSVLLFGGSFDPPHRAHIALPELVRAHLGLDHILYIPAARSPHKADAPGAPGALRARMLSAALKDNPRASVWTVELDRAQAAPGQPSYTIDTIRELLRLRPDISLRLLIGADQALSFHRWREPGAITRLAPPAVMLRNEQGGKGGRGGGASDPINALARVWGNDAARNWASWIVPVPALNVSSTRARQLLQTADAAANPELAAMLPAEVLDILRVDNPYRAAP